MIDVRIDNDLNILFGSSDQKDIEFVENNEMSKLKTLLTAPAGSFYRDKITGVNKMLILNLARLDTLDGLKSYLISYAYRHGIMPLNIEFSLKKGALAVIFYFAGSQLRIENILEQRVTNG